MSEWLSTGQMIDRLKVGEVAESDDGKYHAFWNEANNWLGFKLPHSKDIEYPIIHGDKDRKWRILPKYVTFEEAMKALKDGKKVVFHTETSQNHYGDKMIELQKDSYLHTAFYGWNLHKFETLLEGKWQIIE